MNPEKMCVEMYRQYTIHDVVPLTASSCYVTYTVGGRTVRKHVDFNTIPDTFKLPTFHVVTALRECLVKNGICCVVYYETRKGRPVRYLVAGKAYLWEVNDMSSGPASTLRELLRD